MKLPPDMALWNWVTRTIAPLGRPAPHKKMAVSTADKLFSPTLDLHGKTVQQAYEATLAHIRDAKTSGTKKCLIITGKSGQIRREFPMWLDQHPLLSSVTSENGGGAFKVHLK